MFMFCNKNSFLSRNLYCWPILSKLCNEHVIFSTSAVGKILQKLLDESQKYLILVSFRFRLVQRVKFQFPTQVFSSVFSRIQRRRFKPLRNMLIRNLPTMLFLLIWFVPSIIIAASSHKHSQGKERLEDGAFSSRDHDHFDDGGSNATK